MIGKPVTRRMLILALALPLMTAGLPLRVGIGAGVGVGTGAGAGPASPEAGLPAPPGDCCSASGGCATPSPTGCSCCIDDPALLPMPAGAATLILTACSCDGGSEAGVAAVPSALPPVRAESAPAPQLARPQFAVAVAPPAGFRPEPVPPPPR